MRYSPAVLVFSLLCVTSHADTLRQVMASRYMRTQFCIERAVGQYWHERYAIALKMNRWGASEPTLAGLAKGPPALREAHARCRKANEISEEPIPE